MFSKYITAIFAFIFTTSILGAPEKAISTLPSYRDLITILPIDTQKISSTPSAKNDDMWAPSFNSTVPLTPLTGDISKDLIDYGLNEYLGIESEHTYLPTSAFDHTGSGINHHMVDLLGKISAPINEQLKLHAKAGLAYQNTTQLEALDLTHLPIGSVYGLEADYKMTPQLKLNFSWMRHS